MISGKIVRFRAVQESDLPVLTALANEASVRSMVVGWSWPISPDNQQAWLEGSRNDPNLVRLAVLDGMSDLAIGLTGLWNIDWHNRSAHTAIKLKPENCSRGAGSDSIMLAAAWAFYEVGLHRLSATILPFNLPSLRAYIDKCGWVTEGVERDAVYRNGRWHDLIRIGLLRSDFDSHAQASEYIGYVCPADTPSAVGTIASTPERQSS